MTIPGHFKRFAESPLKNFLAKKSETLLTDATGHSSIALAIGSN